jgi:tetratricopeptide repeat protein 21B
MEEGQEQRRHGSQKVLLKPGYHYCKGLYFKYTLRPNEALREFLQSKQDSVWGVESLERMIEIVLNPNNETLGGEALSMRSKKGRGESSLEGLDGLDGDEGVGREKTLERLFLELERRCPQGLSPRARVLRGHILLHSYMAEKSKAAQDTALVLFMDLLSETQTEYIPALYGLALGHVLMKQVPKARNYLKRVTRAEWSLEFSEDFEKSWILLADLYIQVHLARVKGQM